MKEKFQLSLIWKILHSEIKSHIDVSTMKQMVSNLPELCALFNELSLHEEHEDIPLHRAFGAQSTIFCILFMKCIPGRVFKLKRPRDILDVRWRILAPIYKFNSRFS